MRFGVLGPVGVWTADGRSVRVPERKVRALLAGLLVHRGRPVSADRLVDDLWGAQPPGRPAAALQNKVWHLRRALEAAEPGGRALVAARSPGYQLLVDDDAVDADRFHRLVERARAAADPRTRTALLADALALWRGPAYADFADEEFTRVAAASLAEQRLTALEEQAEARLLLGEHALVADDLGDLVALHPLRERLRTAHVRALYLAGRQGAALRSYAEAREVLADRLGVDPGPELAALHQAVLTQDPALTAVPSPATTAVRSPSNVPRAALIELIGRDAALTELTAAVTGRRLVTLTGPGGVGKTQLALALAARLGGAFPGGVRLVEFAALAPVRTAAAPEVLELVAGVLGVRDDVVPTAAAEPPSLTDRVAQALGDRPTLLVFDNCEHVVEPVAALVADLLSATGSLTVLATGQVPLQVRGEWLYEVGPLAGRDAQELFTARARAAAPHVALDAAHTEAVAAICRRLDGIPLALEMAATRVRVLGVAELAARLDDRFHVLASGVRGAPARQRTLRAVIDWSWGLLGDAEQVVLRRLAVHADGCTLAAAEEVCPTAGVDRAQVLDLLARLVEASLVAVADTPEGPRYRLWESVAAYCVEQVRERGELAELRLRHRDHYAALAERAQPHLRGPEQRRWLRLLDAEGANFRTALEGAVEAEDATRALRLVNALAWYWRLRGRYGEAERSLAQALALAPSSVPAGQDGVRVAAARAWLGGMRLALGGSADPLAEYGAALAPYEHVDDPAGLARARWYVGSNLYGVKDLAPSRDLVLRAQRAFRDLGDAWGTAAALASRAFQAKLRGEFDAVREQGERSLAIFRDLGDGWGQLQAMVPLQTHAEVTGDYPLAGRLFRDGLRMAEDLGLWPEVSFQLSGLGRIALLTGDLAQAQEYHERARRMAVEQSDVFGEQYAEIGLGMGARRQGRLAAAEEHFATVLRLHREQRYEPGAPSLILAELGFVAEARGESAKARQLQQQGLVAARATGDPRAVALALEGLAGAQLASDRAEHAAELLGAAARARASVGVPLPRGERGDVDRISAGARARLGAEGYAEAFRRGGELGPDGP
ncbi:BTAD domain-containing putative transcriptional regulator [Streptomyces sp. NPDC017979]|uniref:BTAD domain-containing putative transcriptional regulator n=1 Tax=Streptomyces sp. NPDC017979 TaxID=3365024 RepID=UPI0037BCDC97